MDDRANTRITARPTLTAVAVGLAIPVWILLFSIHAYAQSFVYKEWRVQVQPKGESAAMTYSATSARGTPAFFTYTCDMADGTCSFFLGIYKAAGMRIATDAEVLIRVDELEPWEATDFAFADENDDFMLYYLVTESGQAARELRNGKMVRLKFSDLEGGPEYVRFSLEGSAAAMLKVREELYFAMKAKREADRIMGPEADHPDSWYF